MIERAFDLAKTGHFSDVVELERHMRKAGFSTLGDLEGRDLRKQLKAVCDEVRGETAKPASAKQPFKPRPKSRPSMF